MNALDGSKTLTASLVMFLSGMASAMNIVIPQDEGAATTAIIGGVLFFVLRLVTKGPLKAPPIIGGRS